MPTNAEDLSRFIERLQQLDLKGSGLPNEYRYGSLDLCAIDAVFSIGVRYEGVQAVVSRYAAQRGVETFRSSAEYPAREDRRPISDLVQFVDTRGVEATTEKVFDNTSERSTSSSDSLRACLG